MTPISLTDRNFETELAVPDRIVLVLFYDENFSNRYLIEPGIAKLDELYGEQVKFCRINIRGNTILADRFRILTSPTLLFFKDGKLIESLSGTLPRIEVENTILRLIADTNESVWLAQHRNTDNEKDNDVKQYSSTKEIES